MPALFWYCASDFPTPNRWKTKRDAGLFCISSASKWIVFLRFLWHFPSLGGGLGGPWVLEAPKLGFWIDFGSILGPLLGPSWLQLRGLGASWGVLTPLGAVFVWSGTLLFPISWPIPFRISFYIDFGSQNDPKIIEKSMKNPCPHEAEKESLFPCLLQRTFKIIWCWSQKGRSSKTMEKTMCFVHFWISTYVNKAQRWCDNDVKKTWKKHCQNHQFLNKKARIFGLDVGTRNFEVLGRILASILGVLGRSWGRLGASWAPLRSSWAPLWLENT